MPRVLAGRPRHPAAVLTGLVRTALVTFLLSGLFTTWWHAALFALAFAFTLLLRGWLPVHVPQWVVLERVPMLLRFLAAVAVSYLVARIIVEPAWTRTGSFLPVLVSVTVSLMILALLLPERVAQRVARRPRAPRRPGGLA